MKLNLFEDKKAKSKSFFFKNDAQKFDERHINFLIKFYTKTKKDVRICLHPNKSSKHHDMVILQSKKNFYLPHKHLRKGETYHILKGSMACVLFNRMGKITKVCKLKKNNLFRTPLNVFHTMLPISNYVIYHEGKTGPFLKKNDSIFPKWNTKLTGNKRLIEKFKKTIYKLIK